MSCTGIYTEVPTAIEELRMHLRTLEPGDIEPYVEVFTDITVHDLAETGWDVYHAREGKQILDQVIAAGRQGPDAVCDGFADAARPLAELRERRDQHNDPITGAPAVGCALAPSRP